MREAVCAVVRGGGGLRGAWWVGLLMLAVTAAGQAQTRWVSGAVVNAVTGAAVGRALVSSADGKVAQLTDGEGQFRVEVPATGETELRARRPGFLPMVEAVRVADGVSRVNLMLRPEAVVAGQVETPQGTPARGVAVELEEQQVRNGRFVWEQRGGAQARFDGEFRMAGLSPGLYRVGTREWAQEGAIGQDDVPELAYPPVESDAMRVGEGQTVSVDLRVRSARYFPVELPVANCGGPEGEMGMGASVRSVSGAEFTLGVDGSLVKGALPAGSYRLRLTCYGPEMRVGDVALTVAGGPVVTQPVSLGLGTTIPVEVQQQFTATDGSAGSAGSAAQTGGGGLPWRRGTVDVRLEPVGGWDHDEEVGRMRRTDAGAPVLSGVGPGSYWVRVTARQGYVASATAGGVDVRREPLVVGSGGGSLPLRVTLRDDGGTVSGTAAAGVRQVRLLPLDNEMTRERSVTVGSDGSYAVQDVPPGRWLVLGSGLQQAQVAYREPAVEQAWESQGVVVEVTPGGTATATVAAVAQGPAASESEGAQP